MVAVESFATNSRGGTQLRRRWEVTDPLAAVLIVHGMGEHSGRYGHVGDHLADHRFDVLAFDQLGFGQSEGRRAHVDSFDQLLDDVEALMAERRELDVPVVLLGHSMGGLVVAAYLVSGRPQPDLAVLSAPLLEVEVEAWRRVAAPILGRIVPRLFIPNKIDGAVLSRDVAVQQAYVNDPLVTTGQTAGMGKAILEAMDRTGKAIHQISIPTYVLHGAEDELVPISASEPLRELPSVTYKVWDGLRHECFNEPEQNEVLAALSKWLLAQLV